MPLLPSEMRAVAIRSGQSLPERATISFMPLPLRLTQRILGKDRASTAVRLAVAAGSLMIVGLIGWRVDWTLRRGSGRPSQGETGLADSDLQIEVHYQLAQESGAFHVLSADDPPLRNGDRVQIHVRAALPLYLYLYWSDSHGSPRRLWPQDPHRQRQLVELLVPRQRDEWFPIEGASGNEMVLVAAALAPLAEAQLAEFEKHPQLPISNDTIAAPVSLPLAQGQRGVGGLVSSNNRPLDGDFLRSLNSTFIGYRGLIFPHR